MIDLDLTGPADALAREIFSKFPLVRFSSGRRSLEAQARAMADNASQHRDWIKRTYKDSLAARLCQQCVDLHPQLEGSSLAMALLVELRKIPWAELKKLSKHLTGEAFDIVPFGGVAGEAFMRWLRERVGELGGVVLEREGGLTRWHVQF